MTVDEYIRRFEWALRDLPWKMQRELVAELHDHIAELELGKGLEERLGSPERYAADLRAAAGLDSRRGAVAYLRAKRPRRLVAIVVAVTLLVTVIGLGIGSVVWIDSYQPLSNPGHYLPPPGGRSLLGLDGEQVTFHAGRPFTLGVGVANNGRFTVRILGVRWNVPGSPWRARLMMSQPHASTGGTYGPNVPFHPVDLAPGHDFFLFFKGVFACRVRQDAGAMPYTDFPVRYSFLWRTATTNIPLTEPLAIYFPKGCRP